MIISIGLKYNSENIYLSFDELKTAIENLVYVQSAEYEKRIQVGGGLAHSNFNIIFKSLVFKNEALLHIGFLIAKHNGIIMP